ncbi:MAG: hypothetical protein WBE86_13195 [Candidatus Acidiferrales bacterium]
MRLKSQEAQLNPFDSSYILLEKGRKSWDYAISDKFVYLVDAFDVALNSFVGIAKDYVEGNVWLAGHLITGRKFIEEDCHYAFIVEFGVPKDVFGNPEFNVAAMHGDSSVLVDVAQEIQTPEKVAINGYGVHSVIRLKRFDDRDCICGNSGSLSDKGIRVSLRKNRELSAFRIIGSETRQAPDELVEGRPKAIQCIASNKRDAVGSGLNTASNLIDFSTIFNIVLSEKLIRLRFVENLQLLPKSIEVFLGPSGLKVGVCQSDSHAEY